VDAGSPLVVAAGVVPHEVLLRMAGHLSRRPGPDKIARYVPPIPPAIFLQSQDKQPDQRTEHDRGCSFFFFASVLASSYMAVFNR
jgi:hypothetical protein